MEKIMKITIIIPFYYGNQYLNRLFQSIEKVSIKTNTLTEYEIIIVNDSPEIDVIIPKTKFKVAIINNERNMGIQQSRVNGLEYASGDWILFLDQDDELREQGYIKQIELTKNADVVVGNGIYILDNVKKRIFLNEKVMNYLIREEKFIQIRNLIPSPGECLIRRAILPTLWKEKILKNNGADDWMLWILLFKKKARFVCNDEIVYVHNDTKGKNLSSNLDLMKRSCLEMLEILEKEQVITIKERYILNHAIEFKYNQDTKQLTIGKILRCLDVICLNIIYRFTLKLYEYENEATI